MLPFYPKNLTSKPRSFPHKNLINTSTSIMYGLSLDNQHAPGWRRSSLTAFQKVSYSRHFLLIVFGVLLSCAGIHIQSKAEIHCLDAGFPDQEHLFDLASVFWYTLEVFVTYSHVRLFFSVSLSFFRAPLLRP